MGLATASVVSGVSADVLQNLIHYLNASLFSCAAVRIDAASTIRQSQNDGCIRMNPVKLSTKKNVPKFYYLVLMLKKIYFVKASRYYFLQHFGQFRK